MIKISSMRLTDEQVEHYLTQGYVVLPALIEKDALARYNERFESIVMGEAELAPGMKIMQDVMVVKGAVRPLTPIHAVNKMLCLEEDPLLFDFASHAALVGAVQSLLGEHLYSLSSNLFNKPPGVDGKHPLHQDLRYFKLGPADKIVGVWTAMLPATRESGCLSVIPGSHLQGLRSHENPDWEFVNHGFFGIEDVDLLARLHVELQPGDTLLFHPLLIHGSGTNKSVHFRRAISVHYAAADCISEKGDWRTNPFTRPIC